MLKISFIFFFILSFARDIQAQEKDRKYHVEFSAGAGRRGMINRQEGVFRSTLSANFSMRIHPVVSLKLGLDALYFDRTNENLLLAWSGKNWAYGITAGSDFKMGRIIFSNGIGRYLQFDSVWEKNNPGDQIKYYTKIGFKYIITQHLLIGFMMRAHRAQADYIDFGFSIRL